MSEVPTILHARAHAHADAHTLARYETTGGYEALRTALGMEPQQIVDEMKASNLRGRGGAGFPCGTKWGFLPPDVRPRYLVINADESEPGTFKDRELLERDPHQLLEGVIISSYATDVHAAFVYIRGEYPRSARRLQRAVDEAYAAGFLGRDILGSGFDLDVVVHIGAGAYICGEETALLASLQGGRGEPRLKPPFFPATQGLYFKPTIVNNVETISNVPWIVKHGGAAYAAIGPEKSAGTRIFSVSGHVNKPGNYEIAMGITFREFLETYAGGMRDARTMKAFIPGGASAIWFTDEHLDVAIDIDVVGQHNSMLGSGAITFMDEDTCMVYASHRVVKFFAHESCGQCTPCREGTTWMQQILWRLVTGEGRPEDLDLLLDVADNIWPSIRSGISWPPKQTTICPLGPSAVSPVASALTYFRKDFERCLDEGGSPWWRARQARAAGGAVQASAVG